MRFLNILGAQSACVEMKKKKSLKKYMRMKLKLLEEFIKDFKIVLRS